MNPVILKDITLFVLDMDGTIYLGERPFPAAIEFIRRAKASGRRIVYFTNNAYFGLFLTAKWDLRKIGGDLPHFCRHLFFAHSFAVAK